jgi:hypothetical protein
MKKILVIVAFFVLFISKMDAAYMLVPMDETTQKDHLKAYGITYWVINQGVEAWWLLNYRGGSFAFPFSKDFEKECKTRGVSYEVLADGQWNNLLNEIANPEVNQDAIKLEKAPKIAVYTPAKNEKGEDIQPWDDAVTLVLTYAEIPYETVYDTEVLQGKLADYDWLHLHHEDFTGQFGRFYGSYHTTAWYKEHVAAQENLARINGFDKVSQLKLAVAKSIAGFVANGGFMFAMCSATDTYDIALAADGLDICAQMYDGDASDPSAQDKLDFSKTFAFEKFQLIKNPLEYH